MHSRGFKCFIKREFRQDRGQTPREHGLTGTGRADHQDVMTAGGSDFECALYGSLAAYFGKIAYIFASIAEETLAIDDNGHDLLIAVQEIYDVAQFAQRIHADIRHQSGLSTVFHRDDKTLDAGSL